MTVESDLYVPLVDIEFFIRDPFPGLARLRREAPVYWDADTGSWAITRYDDICAVARDTELFSSSRVLRPTPGGELMMQFLSGSLLMSDPPRHSFLRRVVNRALSVRAVADLEPFVRARTNELLDNLEPGVTYDVVHDVAEDLPVGVICQLMGIPREDHKRIAAMMSGAVNADASNPDPYADLEAVTGALMDGMEYLQSFVADRLANPRDDLISRISNATEDEAFDEAGALQFAFLLLMAGSETTRGLLARGTELLALHPDQKQRLIDYPSLMPAAVEEILRWSSVLPLSGRRVTADTQIRGVDLKEDDQLFLYFLSGNRDEEVFGTDADDFRIDRAPNPHIAFGFGVHFCIGASLTRLESKVFFNEVLRRFPDFEIAGPPDPVRTFELCRGYKALPVVFH